MKIVLVLVQWEDNCPTNNHLCSMIASVQVTAIRTGEILSMTMTNILQIDI